MSLPKEIAQWVWAVLHAWYGWVGASATAGFIGIGQGMAWWHPTNKTYSYLIGAGFIVSMFQAWAEDHRKLQSYTENVVYRLSAGVHNIVAEPHGSINQNGLNAYDILFQVQLINQTTKNLLIGDCELQYTNVSSVQKKLRPFKLHQWMTRDGLSTVPLPDVIEYIGGNKALIPDHPVEGWLGFRMEGVPFRYPDTLRFALIFKDTAGRIFMQWVNPVERISSTAAQAGVFK